MYMNVLLSTGAFPLPITSRFICQCFLTALKTRHPVFNQPGEETQSCAFNMRQCFWINITHIGTNVQ